MRGPLGMTGDSGNKGDTGTAVQEVALVQQEILDPLD